MAYVDHSQASSRTAGIIFVVAVHIVLGVAFYRGLDVKTMKQVIETVDVFNVKKPPPPPPPPKEKKIITPPVIKPVVVPPAQVKITQPVQQNIVPKTEPQKVIIPTKPVEIAKASRAVPKGAPGGWVTSDDYPTSALSRRASGRTGFTLQIGPDGRVTSCNVTSSSGNAELDARACALLPKRARFKPAIGSDGQPQSDSYSGGVRWTLPD